VGARDDEVLGSVICPSGNGSCFSFLERGGGGWRAKRKRGAFGWGE